MASKKYGLLLPDKSKKPPVFQASRNVFGNDSDSEDEIKKKPLLRLSNVTRRKDKNTQEKAVSEDPTVYQYDEIYEDIVTKKEEAKVKIKVEKKPQYIENLMKAANKRKIENERRIERQIQKEREKEGDEFQDKEVFVTSAYKKKLEEMRLEEEKEKREEYLENIGDVTKQKDLGGFYRHLYEQKLGKETKDQAETSGAEDRDCKTPDVASDMQTQKKRNYRKRKSSDSKAGLSEGEIEDSDEEINRVNLDDIRMAKKHKTENIDADSDFSIDDTSDEEQENTPLRVPQAVPEATERDKVKDTSEASKKPKAIKSDKLKDNIEAPKEKIDIWKKRTVGQVFEEALKRYYERKAARG